MLASTKACIGQLLKDYYKNESKRSKLKQPRVRNSKKLKFGDYVGRLN